MRCKRGFSCDYCGNFLGEVEMETPFQVGSHHYCGEVCALGHHHKLERAKEVLDIPALEQEGQENG